MRTSTTTTTTVRNIYEKDKKTRAGVRHLDLNGYLLKGFNDRVVY